MLKISGNSLLYYYYFSTLLSYKCIQIRDKAFFWVLINYDFLFWQGKQKTVYVYV